METNKPTNLNDPQLTEVSGGRFCPEGKGDNTYSDIDDNRGRYCGQIINGVIYYWPCKKCHRPTHMGSGVNQCDKCDTWFWRISDTPYNGTVDELKRESAAN